MKKFWKNASLRLKIGIFITLFFLILGFVVYFISVGYSSEYYNEE